MMRPLCETLRLLREQKNLTQGDVADWLSVYFKPTKSGSVSSWETGAAVPSGEYLLYLIRLYDVVDVQEVFLGRSHLNSEGVIKLQEYARLLGESPRYSKRTARGAIRQLRFYDIPVSAGTGQFLDSDHCELREVDDWVPAEADYAVRVSGDSMEPRFVDNQWIFVRELSTLVDGDIGIFFYEGDSYCKMLGRDENDNLILISLNEQYQSISIDNTDSFRVLGRVVG